MKYSLKTKHIELSDADKKQLTEKLGRLDKLINDPYVTDVVIEHDTHHKRGDVVTCKITIEQGKHLYHADRTGPTVQVALDEVISAIKNELHKKLGKESDLSQIRR